jgi:hypothetical protein
VGHVVLLVIGALMALSSSCVCGASFANGHGWFDTTGTLLGLVGLLVYGAGRFVGSLQKEAKQ